MIKFCQFRETRPTSKYDVITRVPSLFVDFTDISTLYRDSAGTTPVAVVTDPIGKANDQSGNAAHMLQATTTARPLYKVGGAVFDAVDDSMTVTFGTALGTDCTIVNSINGVGYQMNAGRTIGTTYKLNVDSSKLMLFNRDLTAIELALVERYIGTERKYMILKSSDTTFANMRIYSGGAATSILFIGANGATVTKSLSLDSDTSYDVSADGLTAPVIVVYPDTLRTSPTLQQLYLNSNNLSGSIPDLSANTALTNFNCQVNRLTGSIPSLSANTAMTIFYCHTNQLTGSIPSLSANTAMTIFYCHTNQLTGAIPSLSANTALTNFVCYSNQLTGSIPSLSANTALNGFQCYSNQLTGAIPSLSANTALTTFYCYSNQLTGSIPSLSANTALNNFSCHSNQLTGYEGGGVSITLGYFLAQNNLLTQSAVDLILSDFVAANKTTGTRTLNLGGTGNATPSAAGMVNKATLVSRGWTVTTN